MEQLEEISNIIRVSETRSDWNMELHGSDEEVQLSRAQFIAQNLAYPARKLQWEEELKTIATKLQNVTDLL